MPETTDPALELAELCDRLAIASSDRGDLFLAKQFNVEPWTSEFFQIALSIVNRTIALKQLLIELRIKGAVAAGAQAHLTQIQQAFDLGSLSNQWASRGYTCVTPQHSSPIRMLSAGIPEEYSYPKLTEEEANELRQLVSRLLGWLRRLQLSDRDFIRESLIEGLEQFQFRLDHLSWFGWGYSIQSLRDVILAYLTLERGMVPQENPDAGAVLKRLNVLLRRVYKLATHGREATETYDWVIGCYHFAVGAAAGPALGHIAGLLTKS
jgi:hypothetical protein